MIIILSTFGRSRMMVKCHALVSTKKHLTIKIGDYTIDKSECEKLLDVKIDVNLTLIITYLIYVKKLVEKYLH